MAGRGGIIAVRVLLVLVALAVLYVYGCGQASSPVEKQEKQGGVEHAEGNMPIVGVIGENVEAGSFDLRILDYFTTNEYYYATDPHMDNAQNAISQAGKFIVVNYSVTNTSPQTISPTPMARLHARAGDNVEVYDQSRVVVPPHRLDPQRALDDIPPRQMVVSQFIFDVSTDVEPESLAVTDEPTIYSSLEVGAVDLTENNPQGPRPEEILALQYEYFNMTAWSQGYDLYASETKARVSEQTFTSKMQQDFEKYGDAITDYSFPTVTVEGDRATIKAVRTASRKEGEDQTGVTQEAVLEDEGWRILMASPAAWAVLLKAADWQMNETSGQMIDSSSNDNNGTPTDVVRTGTTYVFNGSTSHVAVPDNDSLDPLAKDITLRARVKVTNEPMDDDSYDVVRRGLTSSTAGDYKMEIKRTSNPTVGRLHCLFKGTGGKVYEVARLDIVDGKWHTLACVKTSNSVVAKVDGRSNTHTGSAGSISNAEAVLVGGKTTTPFDDMFDGEMNFVSIEIAQQ